MSRADNLQAEHDLMGWVAATASDPLNMSKWTSTGALLAAIPDLLAIVRAMERIEPLIDAQFEGHADVAEFMEKSGKLNEALDLCRSALAALREHP